MLRIGVISAYPDEDWHAQQIARAAARRDRVDVLRPTDFAAEVGAGGSRVTVCGRDAAEWDLFLTPRALGDDGDADVQLELYRALARSGAQLCNDVTALLVAIDKFRTSWELAAAGLPTPEARVVQTRAQAEAALATLGEVVVKPVYGSLGVGVERLAAADGPRLRQLLDERGALYLQRFVAGARLDLRAFVVGDHVEAALERAPRAGEFRGNLHLGASARAIELDEATAELAVRAARVVGLDYSGVDLVVGARGAEIIEVNGTPSFRAIEAATGRDIAAAIVDEATRAHRFKKAG